MRMIGALCVLALSSCTPYMQRAFIRWGDADPAADSKVLERWAAASAPEAGKVRVLVDALPEGLVVGPAGLVVEPGFEHTILGSFSTVDLFNTSNQLEEFLVEVRKLAGSEGADLVVARYIDLGHNAAHGIRGIIIKTDPKLGGAKALKTTALPTGMARGANSVF